MDFKYLKIIGAIAGSLGSITTIFTFAWSWFLLPGIDKRIEDQMKTIKDKTEFQSILNSRMCNDSVMAKALTEYHQLKGDFMGPIQRNN